jgi:hypothetical protein
VEDRKPGIAAEGAEKSVLGLKAKPMINLSFPRKRESKAILR